MSSDAIAVRPLLAHDEFNQVVRLQQTIWGFSESDLLPVRLMVVASKIGGQVFGAFASAEMVGFALALPGFKSDGRHYLHSQMVGVLDAYRNAGVGSLLKIEQREDALARNVPWMEWTFDPLELKNAFFNIERLGATISRYELNQYGTTTSHLHGGLPTDRCVAEWDLASARVQSFLDGTPVARAAVVERIEVPNEIGELRTQQPEQARDVQSQVSAQFVQAFAGGLRVTGFERGGTAGAYLLSKGEA